MTTAGQYSTRSYIEGLHEDIPAGIVVFLIALPLCLGIAHASGAPLFSGILAGMVAGLLVAWLSGSQVSVSGPSAGLALIILHAGQTLGSYSMVLLCIMLAGLLQIALGFMRAGTIAAYFPSSVIKGLLAAVGLILILKQIPHAIGYDADFEGDESFLQSDAHTTLTEILYSLQAFSPGAMIVSGIAILIMVAWKTQRIRNNRLLSLMPGPLLAVIWGVSWNLISEARWPGLAIAPLHLVSLPDIGDLNTFVSQLNLPDFSQWRNPEIYRFAGTIALVASIETLLSLEAADRLDPLKRTAPTSRELIAQGFGNLISSLIGGLPMSSVLVYSSANVNAGGRTRIACFTHGVLLLVSALFLSRYLSLIPLSCLAAILLINGYKLTRPALFRDMYRQGADQFIPFVVTIFAILFTDMLTGMIIGLTVGFYHVVRANFQSAVSLTQDGQNFLLRLHKDASFLNKAPLRAALARIGNDSYVIVDGSRAEFIDQDILETLQDFVTSAPARNITVEIKKLEGVLRGGH